MSAPNEKTTQAFWDHTHAAKPRPRLPSSLVVGTANLLRVLRAHVKPGMRVLEIGFAPGKQLAYVAARLGARVAGVDYSETGIAHARELFDKLGLEGDLRCENLFQSSLPHAGFDVVYSAGVAEHFEDPREIIRLHAEFARPGGTAIVLIPDYGGIYGRLQRHFDPENLAIHNLRMMSTQALSALAPHDMLAEVTCVRSGRINPWQISFQRKWPGPLALGANLLLNGIGLLQPVDIGPLCPMLELRMRRAPASSSGTPA